MTLRTDALMTMRSTSIKIYRLFFTTIFVNATFIFEGQVHSGSFLVVTGFGTHYKPICLNTSNSYDSTI